MWIGFILILANLGIYGRAVSFEFLSLDDDQHVTQNALVLNPDFQKIKEIWTKPLNGLYIPLSYSTWGGIHFLSTKLAALKNSNAATRHSPLPLPFHMANLFFHICNSILVFILIFKLLTLPIKDPGRQEYLIAAGIGGLVFLSHPVQVESVAWVSELKGLLCAFFAILATLIYYYHSNKNGSKHVYWIRWISFLFFVLCLFAKPSGLILPFVILSLDFFYLRRSFFDSVKTLSPWFIACLIIGWITRSAQPEQMLSFIPDFWQRCWIAADSASFYLSKLIWPFDLAVDYGRTPQFVIKNQENSWIPIFLFLMGIIAFRKGKSRFTAFGLCFLISVSLNLGFISFYFQWISTVADRYLYLPMLVVALFVGKLWLNLRKNWQKGICITSVVGFSCLSFYHVGFWKNNTALFSHTLDVNSRSFTAYSNLGVLYLGQGEAARAEVLFRKAVAIQGGYAPCHLNLARALKAQGKISEMISSLREAKRLDPKMEWLNQNLSLDEKSLLEL